MRIKNTLENEHVGMIKIHLGSTSQGMKKITMPPPKIYRCIHEDVIPEIYEQAHVTMEFADTQEIDELINILTYFRESAHKTLGKWYEY